MLSFKQKQVVTLLKGEKLPILCCKYFFTWKGWFFCGFWPKNLKGWPDHFETFHKEKSGVLEKKNLESGNLIAVALHAQIGFRRSDQSQSSSPGQPTNGRPALKYFLSETIHAQENGSKSTHFAKFLISNFLKGLTYSAMIYRLSNLINRNRSAAIIS